MRVDEVALLIEFQTVALDVGLLEALAAEAVFACGAEVGKDGLDQAAVPAVLAQDLGGEERTQYRAGIVVAVVYMVVRLRPTQQAVSGAGRVVARTLPEVVE